ncbi:unnamed protein product, partial [marine sediment metagenome]
MKKNGKMDLFYELKGVLENLLEELGIKDYKFERESETTSIVKVKGERVGIFGLFRSYLFMINFQIKDCVFAFDLDFERLLRHVSAAKKFTPIPKYPAVELDFSISVPKETLWEDVEHTIRKASRLIKEVKLFDVYKGRQVG